MDRFAGAVCALILVGSTARAQSPAAAPAPNREALFIMPLRGENTARSVLSTLDDLLAVSVQNLGPYDVSTKKDVDAQLGREKLKDLAGCTDVSCAAELAGAFGTKFILWGTASRLGGKLIVALSIIDTASHKAVERTKVEIEDAESRYSTALDTAVRQLMKIPAGPVAELSFGPRADVRLPVSTAVAPAAPPEVKVGSSSAADLSTMNAQAERLYEAAMDVQENAGGTSSAKADAWCALAAAGPSPYDSQAKVACREWRMFAAEQPLVDRARELEAADEKAPEAIAEAWCRVAALDESHVAKQASVACAQWRKYAENLSAARKRLASDYDKVRVFVRLKRKAPEQKVAVLDAFLATYGGVSAPAVDDARAARTLFSATPPEGWTLCEEAYGRMSCRAHENMVRIAGGTFVPARRKDAVTVTSFWLDTTAVTVEAYDACVRTGVCTKAHTTQGATHDCNSGRAERAKFPINCTDWTQAAAYCAAVGKRLPTEQEWEWAARGGARATKYPWGDEEPDSKRVCMRNRGCPVASAPASDSPDGVHDLACGVMEWTSSVDQAGLKVARGSMSCGVVAWMEPGENRSSWSPEAGGSGVGFRCASDP